MLCCCGNDDSDSDSLQDKSSTGITLIKRNNIQEEGKTPLSSSSSEHPRQSRGNSSEKEVSLEVKHPTKEPETLKLNGVNDLPVREEDIQIDTVRELLAENIDEMSQQALSDAVNRLEAVATRLETLASRSPSSGASRPAQEQAEVTAPFVAAFDDLVSGPFGKFLSLSEQIGGDLKTMADLVSSALKQQRNLLNLAAKRKEPQMNDLAKLLGPLSQKISSVTEFREKSRGSPVFNHLSAISESIPGLGWVTVKPTPGPYVKEFADAATFYTNRVLKDFKEKDQKHCDWAKSWINSLTSLQGYIKEYHTTGVAWNPKGSSLTASDNIAESASGAGAPPPPPPGGAPPPPPPPPPPVEDVTAPSGGGAGEDDARNALFASLNKGTDITKGLKKVSDDMKTHKNPGLRQGPAPFKATQPPKPAPKPGVKVEPKVVKKPPVFELQDKKWVVEYQEGNNNIVINDTNMKQTVYVYQCKNSAIMVKGKVNSIILDGCKKVGIAFDDVVASLEFINCQSVQGQVLGKMPTVSIDKTDGCLIYLSPDSLNTEIVTAKSSEMNILVPVGDGDYKEFPLPEQFKTTWKNNKFVTEIAES